MSNYINIDNIRFLLNEVLKIKNLCKEERFSEYDVESFEALIDATKKFSDRVLYPSYKEMDLQPARYENEKVIVHPVVGEILKHSSESGLIGITFDFEKGGMQLPYTIHIAIFHIMGCANNSAISYVGLIDGAAKLISTFGNEHLKKTFVSKMLSAEWCGTMCLTESQAGSSLADIKTKAVKDKTTEMYKITGQKIFISGGDHAYAKNFVHLVLARVEGAPKGIKGISLFVVPKYRPNKQGELEENDVLTVADFQKMGEKGFCTTHLAFGDKENCIGWLVGEENQGLKYMFQMMNGARIDVGMKAASLATAAYHTSLQYAKERPQGRRLAMEKAKDQTKIINHADVRRLLMRQKAIVEGSVALLLLVSYYQDKEVTTEGDEKKNYKSLLELLTPIAKTYPSEMGIQSTSDGLQVLGGYGFCEDFTLEQYYRDIRIMAIYEGTTAIQSLDLLGRKVVMNNGETMKLFFKEIIDEIKKAKTTEKLQPYTEKLKKASKDLEEVIMYLIPFAIDQKLEKYLADATIFMDLMSTVTIGWQWLKMARIAYEGLESKSKKFPVSFYQAKIHTMKFYFKYELTKVKGLKETILDNEELTIVENSEFMFN